MGSLFGNFLWLVYSRKARCHDGYSSDDHDVGAGTSNCRCLFFFTRETMGLARRCLTPWNPTNRRELKSVAYPHKPAQSYRALHPATTLQQTRTIDSCFPILLGGGEEKDRMALGHWSPRLHGFQSRVDPAAAKWHSRSLGILVWVPEQQP